MSAVARPSPARVVVEATLVLLAVLAYLWLFRLYGFDLVDEGTQLAQIERAASGARPYVDFETGYTPGYFALQATLWHVSGADLVATRTLGIVVHALTAALVFALARLWLGGAIALCLVAFQVAFLLPVSPRFGAPFNTPYPGWLTAPLALVAQALVARVVASRAAGGPHASAPEAALALLAAGFAAGLAFSVKPNAGLLAFGGVALALPLGWPADVRTRVVAWLLRAGAVCGALLLLGGAAARPGYALALLLPLGLAVWRASPGAASTAPTALGDLARLALGFVAPVALWLVPLLFELGVARVARDVLLLDGGAVVTAYLLPLPLPGGAAGALCAGLALAAVFVWAAPRGRALGGAAAVLGAAVAVLLAGPASPREVAEEACLWLGPLALVVGLVLPPAAVAPRARALVVFAAVFALQLFPRPDLIHVAMGAPPLLLAAGAVVRSLADAGAGRAFAVRPALRHALACGILLLCAVRAYPALNARLAEPVVPLDAGPRAPLVLAARHAQEQRWLGDAVRAIAARTRPGADVFYFPDLAGLGFLAERPSRFHYLYFVPGRPDAAGERRTIAELERLAPQLAVTGAPRVPAFRGAEGYFAALVSHLDARYGAPLAVGECVLRERRAAPAESGASALPPGGDGLGSAR